MALREALRMALDSLRVHKLRSFLTLLGLIIGVTTLIAVMTLIQGANTYVEEKIANLGINVFQVSKTPPVVTDFNEFLRSLRYRDLIVDDQRALQAGCASCAAVGAEVSEVATIRYGDQDLTDVVLRGQTANMSWIGTTNLAAGRFFTDIEDRQASPVCILGDGVGAQLFPGLDPLGRTLRVRNEQLLVIGVAERVGPILGQDQDNFLILPLSLLQKMYGTRRSLTLQVKATNQLLLDRAQNDVRTMLRGRRHLEYNAKDDFYIATAETYIDIWGSISSAFFAVFLLISSIASIVGGIVIMNIMLVSVTERTKEIGIRRAVGATQRDVLRQFLLEALVQCLVGGALGIMLGFTTAVVLRQFTPFPATVKVWVALLGVALSSLIGLFFGIYPAVKAARLDPVIALRTE